MSDTKRVAIALRIDEAYPHHQEVLTGVHQYAREHSAWKCVIDEHPEFWDRRNGQAPPYDGVIARASPAMQRRLHKQGVPLVNTWYQHARPGLPGVYLDREQIGQLVANHLLARGFQRFSYVGVADHRQAVEIGRAFARAIAEQGNDCDMNGFENGSFDDRKYWSMLRSNLEQALDALTPPAAVFVSVPWVARLLITLCENRGWHVPQEIAVACLDNLESVVELPPQITCVDSHYDRIGYEAAALLERLMNGEPTPDQPLLVPPKGVIARESTDYFAVDDDVVANALHFISKHLGESLSVQRIARQVAVSPRSLQRRFESVLGRPISNEIRRLRIETAKRLLGEKMQIGHIARVTGFNSLVTMNQVFQRELGMSPRAYRKQLAGNRNLELKEHGE